MREVTVYRGYGGQLQADSLRAALEDAGIRCVVRSATSIASYPINVGPMGEFQILVASHDERRALEVLESTTTPQHADDEVGDDEGPPRGLFSSGKRPTTDRDRRIYLAISMAALLGSVPLFLSSNSAGHVLAILLLLVGFLFLAGSRKP